MNMHDDDLWQLVYVSKAISSISEETLRDIEAEAIRTNSKLGITGVLFYNDGWFLQLLEGPRASVADIYGRIVLDPRHQQASVLYAAPTHERLAGSWSMGVLNVGRMARPTSMLEMLHSIDTELERHDGRDPVLKIVEMFRKMSTPIAA